jgi:ABC-type nitrate/sulfonate/bicarbonate transport system substrate-binding protein
LAAPIIFQLEAAMKSVGMSIDDVQVEIVGTGAILNALTEGQVDALSSRNSEPSN